MSGAVFNEVRNALRKRLTHSCDIFAYEDVKKGSVSKSVLKLQHKGVKCQLSLERQRPAYGTGEVSEYKSKARLIICEDITIAPGTEFDIFFSDAAGSVPERYKCASAPHIYATHQEISLTREGRA